MSDMNWRDKDDLDLSSEDITAMAAEGQEVTVRGPHVPGNGTFISSAPTYGATTVVRPAVRSRTGQIVGAPPTYAAL